MLKNRTKLLLSVAVLLAKYVNASVYIFGLFILFCQTSHFRLWLKPIIAASKVKSIKEEVLLCTASLGLWELNWWCCHSECIDPELLPALLPKTASAQGATVKLLRADSKDVPIQGGKKKKKRWHYSNKQHQNRWQFKKINKWVSYILEPSQLCYLPAKNTLSRSDAIIHTPLF